MLFATGHTLENIMLTIELLPPENMTPAARAAEIAEILARALRRLQNDREDVAVDLGFAGHQRVHDVS